MIVPLADTTPVPSCTPAIVTATTSPTRASPCAAPGVSATDGASTVTVADAWMVIDLRPEPSKSVDEPEARERHRHASAKRRQGADGEKGHIRSARLWRR
jgi:hypothetical protein